MSTSDEEKDKLLQRLNRIRGQVEALRRALEAEASSTAVLQQATAVPRRARRVHRRGDRRSHSRARAGRCRPGVSGPGGRRADRDRAFLSDVRGQFGEPIHPK